MRRRAREAPRTRSRAAEERVVHANDREPCIAAYSFGPKRRPAVNDVRAAYRFSPDGLISEHVDRFDLAAWAAQAMGPAQALLGRTPLLGVVIRRTTRRQLDAFVAEQPIGRV